MTRFGLGLAAIAAVLVAAPVSAQDATAALSTGSLRAGSVTFRPEMAALAQTQTPQAAPTPAPAPPPKKVTVTVGSDFPTLYVFRGIVQEYDSQFTMQPFVDISVAASPTVTVNFGSWNSFNSGSSGGENFDGPWYESDVYGQVTFTAGKFKPGLLYTSYTSPNNAYSAVAELAGVFSFDDSASKVPVSPKIVLAFELSDAQADGGSKKGVYLELGMKPTVKAGPNVTVGFPIQVGLSLKDYYEAPAGTDHSMGYFRFGGNASVPIKKMTHGAWEVHGGVDFYVYTDARAVQTAGQSSPATFRPVGSLGFSVVF